MNNKVVEYVSGLEEQTHVLKNLCQRIVTAFETDCAINSQIYLVKSRVKAWSHLQEKIKRKGRNGKKITKSNVFKEITDLAGVRILILYPQSFRNIHEFILSKIKTKEWKLVEDPKAYIWEDDMKSFFSKELNIHIESKESLYTSVHYVIRLPNSTIACEIQVRTLLEEYFGEIDHQINYPQKTKDETQSNLLKSLAKLIAAGSKLAETIGNRNSVRVSS